MQEWLAHLALLDFPFAGALAPGLRPCLRHAGLAISAEDYVSSCFSVSLFAAACAFPAFLLLDFSPMQSSLLALASSFSALVLMLLLPSYLGQKRAVKAERELGPLLRQLSVELEFMPFERALADASRGGGLLALEFGRALAEVRRGASGVPSALTRIRDRFNSPALERALSQLCVIYSDGAGAEGLRRQADELAALQRNRLRRFSSKLSLVGLVFIAVSCIVPALFAAYCIIGGQFLAFSMSSEQLLFAYAVVFPAADAALLLYVYEKTPKG
ncbi:MAG: hypothetical protein V1787_05105 [Candidatus Micrarchaeota archaeon]